MKMNFGRLQYQTAKLYPDREAVYNVERNRRFTFMELYLLTNKVASIINDRFGLDYGDAYSVILENDNACFFHYCGALFKVKASAVWCGIRESKDEHFWQIDYVKPKICFIETVLLEKYYDAFRERKMEIICMDEPPEKKEGVHYFWDLMAAASDAHSKVEHDFEKDCMLFRFTGGTTSGTGKCCMHGIRSLMTPYYFYFTHTERMYNSNSKHIHLTPLSHGSAMFVLPPYFQGGTNITMNIPDLVKFCEVIQQEKVTHTFLVPTICYRLVEFGAHKKYDLSSLEMVVYAGAPMNPEKLKILIQEMGNIFVTVYGASEAYPPATIMGRSEHLAETEEDTARLYSCGRPVSTVELMLVDDDGNEVPDGEIGEIWIRGPGVAMGYYKSPELTAKEFTEDGWWKSGDLARRDKKGYYYIVDRKKDMIISGGFNVYATEVEAYLGAHPAVLNSAVVGIPHPEWGEAVHAEVVLREGQTATAEELIDFVKNQKAGFKVPKSIAFVKELPLSPVGKVLRRLVREKYWTDQKRRVS